MYRRLLQAKDVYVWLWSTDQRMEQCRCHQRPVLTKSGSIWNLMSPIANCTLVEVTSASMTDFKEHGQIRLAWQHRGWNLIGQQKNLTCCRLQISGDYLKDSRRRNVLLISLSFPPQSLTSCCSEDRSPSTDVFHRWSAILCFLYTCSSMYTLNPSYLYKENKPAWYNYPLSNFLPLKWKDPISQGCMFEYTFFFFLTDGLYTTLWYFFYALSVKCTFVVFQIVNIFSSLFFTVPQFVVEEIKMLWMKTCLIISWFIFDFSGLGDGQFKHHSKSRWQQFTLAEFGYDSWCCSKHMTNYLLPWRPLNKMGFFLKPKIKHHYSLLLKKTGPNFTPKYICEKTWLFWGT